jgi:hypothetical protein
MMMNGINKHHQLKRVIVQSLFNNVQIRSFHASLSHNGNNFEGEESGGGAGFVNATVRTLYSSSSSSLTNQSSIDNSFQIPTINWSWSGS